MVVYKYFIGCTNYTDVKAKYKELVKVHHPDRSTGSHEAFITLQAEYNVLDENSLYPVQNYYKSQAEQFVENALKYSVVKKQQEQTTNLSPDELDEARATNHFNRIRQDDATFDIIDDIVSKAKKEGLSKLWIYQQTQYNIGLNLDHFKYVTFKMKDKVTVAKNLYNNYKLVHV